MTSRIFPRAVRSVLAVVPLAVLTLAGAPASGQSLGGGSGGAVQPVTAYFAVVASDETMLRSGAGELMYPVAKLGRGQLLRVDGEGGGWSRVGYPPGAVAFVMADAVQVDGGGRTATLSKASTLKAYNMTTGLRGSWKAVFDAPLPAGTKLAVIETEPTPDGRGSSAYKVAPPEAARAYVQTVALRRATQEEINAAMATQAIAPPTPVKQTTGSTGVQPGTTTQAQPGPSETPATSTPKTTAEAPPRPSPAPKAAEVPPSPYERLEAAFEAVRKQPAESAEYTELMAEIQKAMDRLDDAAASKLIRRRLQQRLEYLKLQTDIREQKRKLAEAQGGLKENDEIIKRRLEELDRVRQYTIVGRLSASTLYDGKRLPLMYRIQTVGGAGPRTLAYLKPDTKLGIDAKLGQVVGVIGEPNMDAALRLNIITPVRVDTLEPASTPDANAPAAAAPGSGDAPKPPTGG